MNTQDVHKISRMVAPNKLVQEDYGTLCEVHEEQGIEWYIQVSKDRDQPQWITVGEFLKDILLNILLTRSSYVARCLHDYELHRNDFECRCESNK